MKRVAKFCVLAAVIAVGVPTSARAEGLCQPVGRVQFGSDVQNGRGGFGVNAGGMGAGIIGGEVGFGFSPSFFGTKNDFGNNTVLDLMGNVIVGVPIGGHARRRIPALRHRRHGTHPDADRRRQRVQRCQLGAIISGTTSAEA